MAPKYQAPAPKPSGTVPPPSGGRGGYQTSSASRGGRGGAAPAAPITATPQPYRAVTNAWGTNRVHSAAAVTTTAASPAPVPAPHSGGPKPALFFNVATFRDERRKDLYALRIQSATILGLSPQQAMPSPSTIIAIGAKLKPLAYPLYQVPDDASLSAAAIGRVRMVPRPTTLEHVEIVAAMPELVSVRVLVEYFIFVIEKHGAHVDIGGVLPVLLKLTGLLPLHRAGITEGVAAETVEKIEHLRCAAFVAVGALLEMDPKAVYQNLDFLFPPRKGEQLNLDEQPLLASLYKERPPVRATVVYSLSTALLAVQDQLALAAEPAVRVAAPLRSSSASRLGPSSTSSSSTLAPRRFALQLQAFGTTTSSFVSLSERMAGLLNNVHAAMVQAILDPSEDSPLLRSRILNALASLIQMTPYSKCPSSAEALFAQLLPSSVFFQCIQRPRVQSERVAALFCLTALHRNKHAMQFVRGFFESSVPNTPSQKALAPKGAPAAAAVPSSPSDLLSLVVDQLPSLESFRVVCSLAKEQPQVVRRFWTPIHKQIEAVVASIPSSGTPCYAGGQQVAFDVDVERMDRVRDDSYQVLNEAIRTLLYFMGPCTPKCTDEQWAAELSGGNYYQRTAMQSSVASFSEAKQLGVEVSHIAAPKVTSGGKLAISRFSLPLPPAEAAVRGPHVGARATPEERVASLYTVMLHARYSKSEGPRRLGLRCLAHIGDAALRAMPTSDAEKVFRSVVEDSVREPRIEQHLDILATMLKWATYYSYFATPSCFKALVARVAWYLRYFDTDALVCAAAMDVALALMQRANVVHKDAEIDETVVLQTIENARRIGEQHSAYPVIVGQCLKCLSAGTALLRITGLQSTVVVNDKVLTISNDTLTRLHRAMDPAVKGVTVDDEPTRLRRALACLAAKDLLLSDLLRRCDPEACIALVRRICLGVLLGASFAERLAACRVIQALPVDVMVNAGTKITIATLIKNVAEASRFAAQEAHRSTVKQNQSLKQASKLALVQLATAHVPSGLANFMDWVEAQNNAELNEVVASYAVELETAGVIQSAPQSPIRGDAAIE